MAATAAGQAWAADDPDVAVDPGGTAYFGWEDDPVAGHPLIAGRELTGGTVLGDTEFFSAKGQNAESPRAAADPQGGSVWVWARSNGTNKIIQTRHRNAAGDMSGIQNVSGPGENADQAQVAVDANGNAFYVWRRFDTLDDHFRVQARRRGADGSLGAVQTLSAAQGNAANPQVALDAAGNAYFTWTRRDEDAFDIVQARRRSAGGSLGAVQPLTPGGTESSDPQVAVDSAGNAYFAWLNSNDHELGERRRSSTGTLGASHVLSASDRLTAPPQVAVDPSGNAYFTWSFQQLSGNAGGRVRRLSAGGTFGVPQTLTNELNDSLQMAIDSSGNVNFVWRDIFTEGGGASTVESRRRSASGILSSVQTVDPESFGLAPQIAVDPAGNASYTWVLSDGGGGSVIRGRRRSAAGSFGPILPLSN